MPDSPICGGNCNQCNDCPDLDTEVESDCVLTVPAIDTKRDSKMYMRGFEDGKVLGYRIAHRTMEADRKRIEAHWRPE